MVDEVKSAESRKKLLPVVLLLIVVVLIVVFGRGIFNKSGQLSDQTVDQPQNNESSKTTVLDSIRDAVARSVGFKCEYLTDETKTSVWVKGQSIYSETEVKGNKNFSILKEDKVWVWTGKDTNGIYMDLSAVEDTQTQDTGNYKNTEETIEELEKFKQNCWPTDIADSLFNPPADIQFQDLGALMQKFGQ